MTQRTWRWGLYLSIILSTLLVLIFLTPSHPPDARASVLKTTQEALDPSCNALGDLAVHLSEPIREQTTDANGSLTSTCRYQVELTNTHDSYNMMVYSIASGAPKLGDPVSHLRHGHKRLDAGESQVFDMYVEVYPDGAEKSYFWTYLKAVYFGGGFEADCNTMVDHLYTWELPYRLVDAPCMDLSTDPPEIVEWYPPDAAPGAEPSSIPASTQEPSPAESPASPASTEVALNPDQQLEGQGADLMSQLVELLTMGDLGALDQWEGWEGLTDTQRSNLAAIIERLQERRDEYLTPYQQSLPDPELQAQIRQEEVENRVKDKFQAWERIDLMINRERARDKGEWALWLYDNYRGSQLLTNAYEQASTYLDALGDPQQAAQDKATEFLNIPENVGVSPEDAAVAILKETASAANAPARVHYAYYLQSYQKFRDENMGHEDAHRLAMQALRATVDEIPVGFAPESGGILKNQVWTAQYLEDMSKPGGIYDRAFSNLRGNYDPGLAP